jgi:hypothetical protein
MEEIAGEEVEEEEDEEEVEEELPKRAMEERERFLLNAFIRLMLLFSVDAELDSKGWGLRERRRSYGRKTKGRRKE